MTTLSVNRVVYGGGKFVAFGGGGKAAWSADGVTWTKVTYSGLDSIRGIAYGGPAGQEKFVAVGNRIAGVPGTLGELGRIAWSADGVTWEVVDAPQLTFAVDDIAYGGGKFVAVSGQAFYSADGVSWTESTTVDGYKTIDGYPMYGIAYGGVKFVAVGYGGQQEQSEAAYSVDGVSWTKVTNTTFSSRSAIRRIAYGGGKFVAVGDKAAYSADGVTWTEDSPFDGYPMYGIAYGGPAGREKFVAVGLRGKILYSNDQE
jgi:hypothetical protein